MTERELRSGNKNQNKQTVNEDLSEHFGFDTLKTDFLRENEYSSKISKSKDRKST